MCYAIACLFRIHRLSALMLRYPAKDIGPVTTFELLRLNFILVTPCILVPYWLAWSELSVKKTTLVTDITDLTPWVDESYILYARRLPDTLYIVQCSL